MQLFGGVPLPSGQGPEVFSSAQPVPHLVGAGSRIPAAEPLREEEIGPIADGFACRTFDLSPRDGELDT